MINSIKEHKIEFGLVILSIILLVIYTLRFATIFDEDYSLLLSHNSFSNIIKLDSIDVHPPLYYFLLKIFIILTTFWTKSFFIKILSARVLSVVISLISFVFLVKTCKELSIKNNVFVQWLLYLLVPGVISFTYEFIKIRMYSLGALFVIIQLYELINYNKTNKTKYLTIVMIMTTLSLYTNYYTAMISGILLIIYMIDRFINKRNWIKIFFSGICSLVLFLPWVPVLLKQLSWQSNHPIGGFSKQCLVVLLILIIFMYPLIWLYKYMKNTYLFKTYTYMFITSLSSFIVMTCASFIFKPIFAFRYFYPTLLIYCFLGLSIYVMIFKQNNNKLSSFISLIVIIFIVILCGGAYINQMKYYGSSSVQIINSSGYWNHDKNKIIRIPSINNHDKGFDIEKSMYLSEIDKKIIVPNSEYNKPTDIEMTHDNSSYTKLFSNMNKHIIN